MPAFNLGSLRQKVYGRLDTNANLYSSAEVDAVVNEAIRTITLFTGFYRATISVPGFSVANKLFYDTPAGIIAPSFVSFEGRQLQKYSLRRLARLRRGWATDTTATRGRVECWAPVGSGQFVLYPIDAEGGRDISVTGMATPPLLVAVDDVMVLENEYVELIPDYAEHRLPLKEGGKIFADGSLKLNDFYAKMKERKRYESFKMPHYRLLDQKKRAEVAI